MNLKDVTLYHYWRSSSSWRVRWALKIKKVPAREVAVDLLDGTSESEAHLKRNPLGYVPVLEIQNHTLIESAAIVEWLDEMIPTPSFFPGSSYDRAHIRALVEIINAGTQPVQNLTVMDKYSQDEAKRLEWNQYFIRRGLSAFEKLTQSHGGEFSYGDSLTAADLFLIPQVYNALRFKVNMDEFPLISKINQNCLKLPECLGSHPDQYKP